VKDRTNVIGISTDAQPQPRPQTQTCATTLTLNLYLLVPLIPTVLSVSTNKDVSFIMGSANTLNLATVTTTRSALIPQVNVLRMILVKVSPTVGGVPSLMAVPGVPTLANAHQTVLQEDASTILECAQTATVTPILQTDALLAHLNPDVSSRMANVFKAPNHVIPPLVTTLLANALRPKTLLAPKPLVALLTEPVRAVFLLTMFRVASVLGREDNARITVPVGVLSVLKRATNASFLLVVGDNADF